MYSNIKKFKEAEKEYKEALKINKLDPSIYVLIANVYYMNNEIERSIYSYRAAVNMQWTKISIVKYGTLKIV
mgnify:CR=1 FL=1